MPKSKKDKIINFKYEEYKFYIRPWSESGKKKYKKEVTPINLGISKFIQNLYNIPEICTKYFDLIFRTNPDSSNIILVNFIFFFFFESFD